MLDISHPNVDKLSQSAQQQQLASLILKVRNPYRQCKALSLSSRITRCKRQRSHAACNRSTIDFGECTRRVIDQVFGGFAKGDRRVLRRSTCILPSPGQLLGTNSGAVPATKPRERIEIMAASWISIDRNPSGASQQIRYRYQNLPARCREWSHPCCIIEGFARLFDF